MVTAVFQSRSCTIMLRCFVLLLFLGFSSPFPTITLLKGSQFKLQCLPDSDLLAPEYSWTFKHQPNKSTAVKIQFSPLIDTDEALELNPVEFHHAGIYKCVAKGFTETATKTMKRTFTINVLDPEKLPLITWTIHEGAEGESVTLPCFTPPETVKSLNSVKAKWFKVKELENGFDEQEIKPVLRRKSSVKKKETPGTRKFYWASDGKVQDWSIEIDSLEPGDESLYRCDIDTGSRKEKLLLELVVQRAPPPRCLNDSHPWEPCPDPDNKSWEAILHESLTEFSVNLYKTVNGIEPESNLFFSPISIAVLLSQLLLGTRRETRTELEKGLSLPTGFTCIHSEMKRLSSKTKQSLLIANHIFFNPGLKLQEAFINQSKEFYDSVPQKLTNDSARNVKLINSWVANHTQNRITELVDSVDESIEFILLNAVYFIGKWKGTFEVRDGEFTTFSGEVLSVPILYSLNFNLATGYIHELKAQVGKFALTGKNSLYVILPSSETKRGLQVTEALLTEENIRHMVTEMASVAPISCEVSLPKVKLLVTTDLLLLLKKLKLSGLFNDPNLCGIFDQNKVTPLSDARHRAFLSLTEKGVEAAAASSISFSRSFSNFNALRPFVLIVWNEEINTPLFIGRLLHPEKKE
ncbi:hypothetical protein AMELA_G00266010 [Ameiurus melas]|uniref:Ig-like domain-containing protein n=1 Tax=Ameiurus melas TaxID=219545 RepID=A0A7J5ZSS1_AMEME|nr:hypothetical protein AMELA_G00266010 [Ameiurus melas]